MLNEYLTQAQNIILENFYKFFYGDQPAVSESDEDSIHLLASKGDLKRLRFLIGNSTINFDAPDLNGCTPIHSAAGAGQLEVVDFLIKQGARINTANTQGKTPLYLAMSSANKDLVSFMLSNGASVDVFDENLQTPLHLAVINKWIDSLLLLLEVPDLKINQPDKFGKTPLIYAAEHGDLRTCKLLLDKNAFVNLSDNDGWTAIMYATAKEHLDIISTLMSLGADVECCDHIYRQTPYLLACKMNKLEAAKLLIRYEARIDALDYYSRNALHLAVETQSFDMVKFVLQTNVLITQKDKFGLTPREWAVVNSTPEILKLIINAEAQRN